MTTLTNEQITAFENGAKAMEALKTEIMPLKGKLDAFDEAKFAKFEKSIGDAIAMSQAAEAKAKAAEDDKKAIETQLKTLEEKQGLLETALNRPIYAQAEKKDDGDAEFQAKSHKFFTEFARRGGNPDRGFIEFLEKGDEQKHLAMKAMSVNSDPDGGYLVIPSFGGTIETFVRETSPMRQLASVDTISTDSMEYVVDNDEAGAGWVNESQTRPTTATPRIGKLIIPVHEIYAQPEATQKLIDDSAIDIEAWLARKVADKFAREENKAFIAGDGVSKPRGILTHTAGTDVGAQQVQQIITGSASAFVYDGLINAQSALKEKYQANASWLVNRLGFGNLLLVKDLNGTPIFNMNYDMRVGLQRSVLGAPLYFAADMPVVATNALAAAYGDFKEAYQILDRTGIRVLRDPFTNKPFVKFYTTKRVGGAVKNFEAYVLVKVAAS